MVFDNDYQREVSLIYGMKRTIPPSSDGSGERPNWLPVLTLPLPVNPPQSLLLAMESQLVACLVWLGRQHPLTQVEEFGSEWDKESGTRLATERLAQVRSLMPKPATELV